MDCDLPVELGELNAPGEQCSEDSAAAGALLVELQSRIAATPLHAKAGDETRVANSIVEMIEKGRAILRGYPTARRSQRVFIAMYRHVLAPRTERWSRSIARGDFKSADRCRRFRDELDELRVALIRVAKLYKALRDGRTLEQDDLYVGIDIDTSGTPTIQSRQAKQPIDVRIEGFKQASEILAAEEMEIAGSERIRNGVGLAVSGGGIRSATFALGVVGILARRGLFHQIDYLSTVSGGGYLGTFLSSYLADPARAIDEVFDRDTEFDTKPVRHLRNNSKYLLKKLAEIIKKRKIHRFYRDRLCECYMVSLAGETIAHRKRLNLSTLGKPGVFRRMLGFVPYHLINTAVNLPLSKNVELRGRNADFFLFSKRYCGSVVTEYVDTPKFERADRDLDLGTAMAISGAALSSNEGTNTSKIRRPILALSGFGLGYCLPNIKQDDSTVSYGRPGIGYRLKEASGRLDERASHLNLSDGGHIENLGVYELLRRHCKYIIAVDGECDPELFFDGLIKMIRYARIDFGAEVVLDPAELAKDEKGFSETHQLLGKIIYKNGEIGWLLYIKLTLTGDEAPDVLDYHRIHPDFPHQTTSDQLYSERQFESYRKLGEHVGKGLFTQRILSVRGSEFYAKSCNGETDLETWFESLIMTQLSDNDSAFKKDPTNLSGLSVGLSISNSPEKEASEINGATLDACRLLVGLGATVVTGHDWREDGIMRSIAQIAMEDFLVHRRQREPRPVVNINKVGSEHAMPNDLDPRIGGMIEYKQVEVLREALNERCNARICMGGNFENEKGGVPGVLQEAWMSAKSGRMVLVSACLGGISEWIVRRLQNEGDLSELTHYSDPESLGMPNDPKAVIEAIRGVIPDELMSMHTRLWQTTQLEAALPIMMDILDRYAEIRCRKQ